MNETQSYLTPLIDALQLLAGDYETQRDLLPDFVHLPDELALTFSDAVLLLDQAIEAGEVTLQQAARFQAIDITLEQMSQYAELWGDVTTTPTWDAIRNQARDLLALLGQPVQPSLPASTHYTLSSPRSIEALFD